MAGKSLGEQLSEITRKYEAMLTATAKEAAQNLTEEMLAPRARGGRMPVDTGALRNSFVAGVNSTPSGPSSSAEVRGGFDLQPIVLAINRVNIGDRLVIGTAMVYAGVMEGRYAYLRSAAQNWNQHVDKAARKVRREVG